MLIRILITMNCLAIAFVPRLVKPAEPGQDIGFTVQPDQCIALHQGQVCYQQLGFRWLTPADGEYCLFELDLPEPLLCWMGDQSNSHSLEFASDRSITYQIRTRDQGAVISEVAVGVSWVYRSTRKSFSRWRLF